MSINKKLDDIYATIADQIIDSGANLSQMFEKDGLLLDFKYKLFYPNKSNNIFKYLVPI